MLSFSFVCSPHDARRHRLPTPRLLPVVPLYRFSRIEQLKWEVIVFFYFADRGTFEDLLFISPGLFIKAQRLSSDKPPKVAGQAPIELREGPMLCVYPPIAPLRPQSGVASIYVSSISRPLKHAWNIRNTSPPHVPCGLTSFPCPFDPGNVGTPYATLSLPSTSCSSRWWYSKNTCSSFLSSILFTTPSLNLASTALPYFRKSISIGLGAQSFSSNALALSHPRSPFRSYACLSAEAAHSSYFRKGNMCTNCTSSKASTSYGMEMPLAQKWLVLVHFLMRGYNLSSSMYPKGAWFVPPNLRSMPHVSSRLKLHATRRVVDPVLGPQWITTTMRLDDFGRDDTVLADARRSSY
mmetsp:Transcript_52242/g.156780  ORF Transcript_52242/g.156780 Transcript_52242/m.156780 type:complete len:352 (+) Transcript_52242:59-1114(+)